MNRLKFFLGLVLLIVILLLMDTRSIFSQPFHEWGGLIVGALFILHKLLNWGWIKRVTLLFFKSTTWRARLNYIIDLMMLTGLILIILSGIAMAKTINFSWLNIGGSHVFWKTLHTSSSLITFALFGIHLGLHWNWVLHRLNFKTTKNDKEN
jgi:hypothetical protein